MSAALAPGDLDSRRAQLDRLETAALRQARWCLVRKPLEDEPPLSEADRTAQAAETIRWFGEVIGPLRAQLALDESRVRVARIIADLEREAVERRRAERGCAGSFDPDLPREATEPDGPWGNDYE